MAKKRMQMAQKSWKIEEIFPRFVNAQMAKGVSDKTVLTYNRHFHSLGYHLDMTMTFAGAVKLYANKRVEYVSRNSILRNIDFVDKDKVIVPKAVGSGDPKTDVIKPLYCEPNACCTETYLLVGPFPNKEICENVISYIGTKFFHFLVTLQKNTQDCMKRVYSFVPVQDFSKPWTDEELYAKYALTKSEIDFIEAMVWSAD